MLFSESRIILNSSLVSIVSLFKLHELSIMTLLKSKQEAYFLPNKNSLTKTNLSKKNNT